MSTGLLKVASVIICIHSAILLTSFNWGDTYHDLVVIV